MQGVDRVLDRFNGREGRIKSPMAMSSCGRSRNIRGNFNIGHAMLFEQFKMAEAACRKYRAGWREGTAIRRTSDGAAGL